MSNWLSAIISTICGFNQNKYDLQWSDRLNYLIENCKWKVDFHEDLYNTMDEPEAFTITFDDNGRKITVWCGNFPYSFSSPYRNGNTNVNLKVRASIRTMVKLKEMFDSEIANESRRISKKNRSQVM
jgi:hypothetical protein